MPEVLGAPVAADQVMLSHKVALTASVYMGLTPLCVTRKLSFDSAFTEVDSQHAALFVLRST